MFNRNSESTEQLSAHARCLLNQQVRQQLQETECNDESLEQMSQEDSIYAGRISVGGARRRLRAEWAELKGDRASLGAPLAGVVALVCVRKDTKAVALRAALTALGATVALKWSLLVTHLIWEVGAERSVRVSARRLNAHVIGPQWVEACAADCSHVPERLYATRVRPSDPLDPPALTRILKIVEKENLPILEETGSSSDGSAITLRINDSTDTSRNKSTDKSTDQSKNKSAHTISDDSERNSLDSSLAPSTDTRINTAPRKMHPKNVSPLPPLKSRRKLFKNLEENASESSDYESDKVNRVKCKNPYGSPPHRKTGRRKKQNISEIGKRNAKEKDKWTVDNSLLRLLIDDPKQKAPPTSKPTQPEPIHKLNPSQRQPCSLSNNQYKARIVLSGMSRSDRSHLRELAASVGCKVDSCVTSHTSHVVLTSRRRTLAALEGAVRGCWLVTDRFLKDSAEKHLLVDPREYQVEEFRKTSNKARIERTALQLRKFALQLFADIRVCVDGRVPHADELKRLLQLCGATVIHGLHTEEQQADITIGNPPHSPGGVCVVPRWVSDSVAAGRARSTRLYRTTLSDQHTR